MKKIIAVFSILTVVFISCSKHRYPEQLKVADSLCYANPDSAVTYLKKLKPQTENMNSDAKWYYRLLCVKAANGTYCKPESDEEVMKIVEHYENEGDKEMLPEAYYYAGRVLKGLNDSEYALEYFQKVLDATNENKDLLLISRAYNQMGYIFSSQGLYENALHTYKKSEMYAIMIKDTTQLIYKLRDIGAAYSDLGKLDSAIIYYNKALQLAEKQRNIDLQATVHGQIATIYIYKKNYQEAEEHLNFAREYNDPYDKNAILTISALFYEATNKKDSAYLCYKELLKTGKITQKQMATEKLAKYYAAKQDLNKAFNYFTECLEYTDSLKKITEAESIAKLNKIYNYKIRQKENEKLKADNKEKNIQLAKVILMEVLLISILSGIIVYVWKKRNVLKYKLDQYEQKKKKKKEAKKQIVIQKEDEIKETEIMKIINKKLHDHNIKYRDLDVKERKLLDKTINELFPDFNKKLLELCDVSPNEKVVSQLIKIGISPANMATLTKQSKSGITSIRARLYEKAFNEKKGAAAWDEVISLL